VNILLLGPQGSGKGTQAKRISAEVGVPHVSTGDMFREAIAVQTDLGRRVEPILASGLLVPDELTIALIRDRLGRGDALRGFVLDGFPRNLAQAKALETALAREGIAPDAAIYLDVPEDELRRRLLARARIEHRSDDTPEVIDHRLEVFREATQPIVDHYRGRGQLIAVAGDRPPDDVTGDLMTALSDLPRTPEQQ